MSLEPLRPGELRGHDLDAEMPATIFRAGMSRVAMTVVDDLQHVGAKAASNRARILATRSRSRMNLQDGLDLDLAEYTLDRVRIARSSIRVRSRANRTRR